MHGNSCFTCSTFIIIHFLTNDVLALWRCRCRRSRRLCLNSQGPVVRSLVSANRWLRGMKSYTFQWYLTLVSANHASSNPGLVFT